MKNYCGLVSRTPPEGFWEWAEKADRKDEENAGGLDTFGLVYEKVFVPDTTVDGMIGSRIGKKIPVVRCTCSACGSTWDEGYVHAHAPDGATYGFCLEIRDATDLRRRQAETACSAHTVAHRCISSAKVRSGGIFMPVMLSSVRKVTT